MLLGPCNLAVVKQLLVLWGDSNLVSSNYLAQKLVQYE